MTKGQHAAQPVEQPVQIVKEETTCRTTQAAGDELPEDDPEHHANDKLDPNILLASPEFCRELDIICQSVFKQFGPSEKYPQWEDLRQETLMRFVPWLEENEVEETLKSILNKIVENLCIDGERHRKALRRAHVEVDLDEVDIEALRKPAADADLRIFFMECRGRFSGRKLTVFDEYYVEGRSLSEIAKRHGFSAQTAVNLNGEILEELRHLVSSRKD